MRSFALVAMLAPQSALAQSAPSDAAPAEEEQTETKPKKGRIYDPWPRIPRPRDKMKLPDPRTAAERSANDTPADPSPPEPQVVADPEPIVATEAEGSNAVLAATLPASTSALGTTSIARAPAPTAAPHEGLTLEAGTGAGWIHVAERYRSVTSPQGVAGLSLGIGGWLSTSAALTVRLAGSSVPTSGGYVAAGWLGPSLQLWFSQRTWVGFGLGLAVFNVDSDDDYSFDGIGLDFRLGHTFYANGKHTLNASLELTPSSVDGRSPSGQNLAIRTTSIGFLIGWQYL